MHRTHPILAAGLASVLILTGCGSDGDPAGPDDAPSSSSSSSGEPSSQPSSSPAAPTDEITLVAEPYGEAPDMEPMSAADRKRWLRPVKQTLKASRAGGTPGVWIAVSVPGQGFWADALGSADADGTPATLADHSRVGSITKSFTATAVLQQVADGTLALDDTVADVVPDIAEEFPPTADITVEQLLSMDSGLPDYANVPGAAFAQAAEDLDRVWTPEDLVRAALEASDPTPPGTDGYTTTGYAILGLMLEEVTGEPLDAVVTGVAEEAGLSQTALTPPDDNAMPEPFARGYQDEGGVVSMRDLGADVPLGTDMTDLQVTSLGGAGGGMYSTVGDLFNWAVSASGSSLLPDDIAAHRLELDTDIGGGSLYGEGIMSIEDLVGHTGQSIGYTAAALYDPETGATMAIMTNSTEGLTAYAGVLLGGIVAAAAG